MTREPGRAEVGVAVAAAIALGAVGFAVVGFAVFAATVFLLPGLGPALLAAGAVAGGWLALRGRRWGRGFGFGMLLGWVALAAWTSGATVLWGIVR